MKTWCPVFSLLKLCATNSNFTESDQLRNPQTVFKTAYFTLSCNFCTLNFMSFYVCFEITTNPNFTRCGHLRNHQMIFKTTILRWVVTFDRPKHLDSWINRESSRWSYNLSKIQARSNSSIVFLKQMHFLLKSQDFGVKVWDRGVPSHCLFASLWS